MIKEEYPPNYQEIKRYYGELEKHQPIFAYGNDIYNPFKVEIPEDIIFHEKVHLEQQKKYTSPNIWWTKYLLDKDFRQDQEIEAYVRQYQLWKKLAPDKVCKEMLSSFAEALTGGLYQLDLTQSEAETLLRLKYKEYAT